MSHIRSKLARHVGKRELVNFVKSLPEIEEKNKYALILVDDIAGKNN